MLLDILQVICAVILVALILLQNRGAGLGATFGGDSNVYRTKRGAERFLFITTIVMAVAFIALAIINVINS